MDSNTVTAQVEEYLKSIRTDLTEIKNRQLIGSDNLEIYKIESDEPYDYTFSITNAVPGVLGTYEARFSFYSRYQDFFFSQLVAEVWKDEVKPENKLPPGNVRAGDDSYFETPEYAGHRILIYGENGDYFLKYYYLSTDKGDGQPIIDSWL